MIAEIIYDKNLWRKQLLMFFSQTVNWAIFGRQAGSSERRCPLTFLFFVVLLKRVDDKTQTNTVNFLSHSFSYDMAKETLHGHLQMVVPYFVSVYYKVGAFCGGLKNTALTTKDCCWMTNTILHGKTVRIQLSQRKTRTVITTKYKDVFRTMNETYLVEEPCSSRLSPGVLQLY